MHLVVAQSSWNVGRDRAWHHKVCGVVQALFVKLADPQSTSCESQHLTRPELRSTRPTRDW